MTTIKNKEIRTSLQIICLPFSGGSGFAFQPIAKYYPSSWKVRTITYPGRGLRIKEPLAFTMKDLLEDSWQQIKKLMQPPYVLLGHSLGSILAYLLTHKAIENNYPLPVHLILSGTDGPSVPSDKFHRYLFSKTDFKAKLNSYGGIPQALLNDDVAFDFFEPIIRADFQVVETWQYREQPKLKIPATVITGTDEAMTEKEIRLWQKEFKSPIRFLKMQGNHFFLFEQPRTFVEKIQEQIDFTLKKGSNC